VPGYGRTVPPGQEDFSQWFNQDFNPVLTLGTIQFNVSPFFSGTSHKALTRSAVLEEHPAAGLEVLKGRQIMPTNLTPMCLFPTKGNDCPNLCLAYNRLSKRRKSLRPLENGALQTTSLLWRHPNLPFFQGGAFFGIPRVKPWAEGYSPVRGTNLSKFTLGAVPPCFPSDWLTRFYGCWQRSLRKGKIFD
jgi:hypothetical protein